MRMNPAFVLLMVFVASSPMVMGNDLHPGDIGHVKLLQWAQPPLTNSPMETGISFSVNEFGEYYSSGGGSTVIVFVNSSLLPALEEELRVYALTLTALGYDSVLLNVSGGQAEDIKQIAIDYSAEGYDLAGLVLVGDLPAAWFYHPFDIGGMPAQFPCDLFLMDLDGLWQDTDDDGLYDSHGPGNGDVAPEVFVGRIDASKVPGDQEALLADYLEKVHRYWVGEIDSTGKGLTYTDERWKDSNDIKFSLGYAYDNYEAFWYPSVNRDDYVNDRLPDDSYDFIQLACHSSSVDHSFSIGGSVTNSDVRSAPPRAIFYNLFACGALRFTDYNCIGNSYIMGTDTDSLAVLGSTKSGSMLNMEDFYTQIGAGKSFGAALKKWFENQAPFDEMEVTWFYGMTILGDPTLTPIEPPNLAPVIISEPGEIAARNFMYRYDVNVSNIDDDPLNFSLLISPPGMTINPDTGLISWTPNGTHLDSYQVELCVMDDRGGLDVQRFNLSVVSPPEDYQMQEYAWVKEEDQPVETWGQYNNTGCGVLNLTYRLEKVSLAYVVRSDSSNITATFLTYHNSSHSGQGTGFNQSGHLFPEAHPNWSTTLCPSGTRTIGDHTYQIFITDFDPEGAPGIWQIRINETGPGHGSSWDDPAGNPNVQWMFFRVPILTGALREVRDEYGRVDPFHIDGELPSTRLNATMVLDPPGNTTGTNLAVVKWIDPGGNTIMNRSRPISYRRDSGWITRDIVDLNASSFPPNATNPYTVEIRMGSYLGVQYFHVFSFYQEVWINTTIDVQTAEGQWFDPSGFEVNFTAIMDTSIAENPYQNLNNLSIQMWRGGKFLRTLANVSWNITGYEPLPNGAQRYSWTGSIPSQIIDNEAGFLPEYFGTFHVRTVSRSGLFPGAEECQTFYIDDPVEGYTSLHQASSIPRDVFERNPGKIWANFEFDPIFLRRRQNPNDQYQNSQVNITWFYPNGTAIEPPGLNQTSMTMDGSWPSGQMWSCGSLNMDRHLPLGRYRAVAEAFTDTGYGVEEIVSFQIVESSSELDAEWSFNTSDIFENRTFGSGHQGCQTIWDIDGDGANEVVFGTQRGDSERMWCVDQFGNFEWIYPPLAENGLPGSTSKVSLVDVEGDLMPELCFVDGGTSLHVLSGHGTSIWTWDNPRGAYLSGAPQAYDVDGDGLVEFFMNDDHGYIHRVSHEGVLVWTSFQCGGPNGFHPTIADIDSDDEMEIIWISHDHNLYVAESGNGTEEWRFNAGSTPHSSPVVADVDGDDEYEAVVCTGPPSASVIIVNSNGTEASRWTEPGGKDIGMAQPIGDLDYDGHLDMALMSGSNIYVIDLVTMNTKWEKNVTQWTQDKIIPKGAMEGQETDYLLIVDFDGDGNLEILMLVPFPLVVDAISGNLEAYYWNEHLALNCTQENGGWWGDVDQDGESEWVVELKGKTLSETQLYCLTAGGQYPTKSSWPERDHSALSAVKQREMALSLVSAYSNSLWFPITQRLSCLPLSPIDGATGAVNPVKMVARTGPPHENVTLEFMVDGVLRDQAVTNATGHATVAINASLGLHEWTVISRKPGWEPGISSIWNFSIAAPELTTERERKYGLETGLGELTYGHQRVCDIDQDDGLEVVIPVNGNFGRILCVEGDSGNIRWIYPPLGQDGIPGNISGVPCIGDMDGDGKDEIIFTAVNNSGGNLYSINAGNGSLRWVGPGSAQGTPCLHDFTGNGKADVVCAGQLSMNVFDQAGQRIWSFDTKNKPLGVPNAFDIDEDGIIEILWGDDQGNLICAGSDGNERWRFPFGSCMVHQPIVADFNQDGEYQVLVHSNDRYLYLLSAHGSEIWRSTLGEHLWGVINGTGIHGGGIATGDIDLDGYLEIVTVDLAGNVYAINHDGSLLWRSRVSGITGGSILIGDMTGDGRPDIILGWGCNCDGLQSGSGAVLSGYSGEIQYFYPRGLGGFEPSAGDLDGDGEVEIAGSGRDGPFATLTASAPYKGGHWPWPFKYRTLGNNGIIEKKEPLWELEGEVTVRMPSIPADCNQDGRVDVFDMVLVGRALGSVEGQESYESYVDLNGDGSINVFDLVLVGKDFGKHGAFSQDDEFVMEVLANNVTDLYHIQFDLNYDPTILEFVNITEGTFMASDGASTIWKSPSVDSSHGEILGAGLTRTGVSFGASGSGPVASVCFAVKAQGKSPLYPQNVRLEDSNGYAIGAEVLPLEITTN